MHFGRPPLVFCNSRLPGGPKLQVYVFFIFPCAAMPGTAKNRSQTGNKKEKTREGQGGLTRRPGNETQAPRRLGTCAGSAQQPGQTQLLEHVGGGLIACSMSAQHVNDEIPNNCARIRNLDTPKLLRNSIAVRSPQLRRRSKGRRRST